MRSTPSTNRILSATAITLWVVLAVFGSNCRAAVETTDSEELRSRARQEAQERERQQQLPRVDLQGELPQAGPLQFPGAETPCFTIRDFILEVPRQLSPAARRYGASTLPPDTFRFARDYLGQYTGRCIGREGINFIARGITAQILAHGYSTTRIGIPQQDLAGGTFKLTLIPGIIRELRFADAETSGTWRNAFPTASGKLLNLRDLEQGLEQMKRVTSQEVELQIVPAENIGESDIVISVKRGKPWRVIANLDDSGAKGTGKTQAGVQLGWDNPFGASDLFNIGINTDADRNSSLRGTQGNNLSYSIPFGYWTAFFSANESTYHQRIAGAVSSFVSSGNAQNFEAKFSYLSIATNTARAACNSVPANAGAMPSSTTPKSPCRSATPRWPNSRSFTNTTSAGRNWIPPLPTAGARPGSARKRMRPICLQPARATAMHSKRWMWRWSYRSR